MSKLHGLTWAPARRFVVVVAYERAEEIDGSRSTWTEGWPVAAFTADGAPIISDTGLLTVPELLERYARDATCQQVTWSMESAENAFVGTRRCG